MQVELQPIDLLRQLVLQIVQEDDLARVDGLAALFGGGVEVVVETGRQQSQLVEGVELAQSALVGAQPVHGLLVSSLFLNVTDGPGLPLAAHEFLQVGLQRLRIRLSCGLPRFHDDLQTGLLLPGVLVLLQQLNNFIRLLLDFVDYLLSFLPFLDRLPHAGLIVAQFSKPLPRLFGRCDFVGREMRGPGLFLLAVGESGLDGMFLKAKEILIVGLLAVEGEEALVLVRKGVHYNRKQYGEEGAAGSILAEQRIISIENRGQQPLFVSCGRRLQQVLQTAVPPHRPLHHHPLNTGFCSLPQPHAPLHLPQEPLHRRTVPVVHLVHSPVDVDLLLRRLAAGRARLGGGGFGGGAAGGGRGWAEGGCGRGGAMWLLKCVLLSCSLQSEPDLGREQLSSCMRML